MKKFSKIFILLIGINFIYGDTYVESKYDEELKEDISYYYEKLIANHILEVVLNIQNYCVNQTVISCIFLLSPSLNNLNNMVEIVNNVDKNTFLSSLFKLIQSISNDELNVTFSKFFIGLLPKNITIKNGIYDLDGKYGPLGDYGFDGPYLPKGPFKDYVSEIEAIIKEKIKANIENQSLQNIKNTKLFGRKLFRPFICLGKICRFVLGFFHSEDDCI
jgi:hypothetical protein